MCELEDSIDEMKDILGSNRFKNIEHKTEDFFYEKLDEILKKQTECRIIEDKISKIGIEIKHIVTKDYEFAYDYNDKLFYFRNLKTGEEERYF